MFPRLDPRSPALPVGPVMESAPARNTSQDIMAHCAAETKSEPLTELLVDICGTSNRLFRNFEAPPQGIASPPLP